MILMLLCFSAGCTALGRLSNINVYTTNGVESINRQFKGIFCLYINIIETHMVELFENMFFTFINLMLIGKLILKYEISNLG